MDGWADTADSTMFKYNEKKRNKEKKMKKSEWNKIRFRGKTNKKMVISE